TKGVQVRRQSTVDGRRSVGGRAAYDADRLPETEACAGVRIRDRRHRWTRTEANVEQRGGGARPGTRVAGAVAVALHGGAVQPQRIARRLGARRIARQRIPDPAPAETRTHVADAALRRPARRRTSGGRNEGVVPITAVPAIVRESIFDWRNTRAADLLFTHRSTAVLALVALIGLCAAVMILRARTGRNAGGPQVALPAVLNWGQSSWLSIVRHGALILFLVGVPFFAVALADPYSTLTQEDVSFPGRRIALMIDASSSMMARFPA